MSPELASRLHNWKFGSAQDLAAKERLPAHQAELIQALGETFGNSGWFEGGMGVIVMAAVASLLGERSEVSG